MKNQIFIIAIAVSAVFAGAFIYFKNSAQINRTSSNELQPSNSSEVFSAVPISTDLLIKPHSPVLGATSAKVTIVEFLDPECEACAAMYPITKEVLKEFKDQVTFVVRYMPFHGNSKYVANILEGARAQGKYWEAMELLFANQSQWASHDKPNINVVPEILAPLKLNMTKIIEDAKAGKYDQIIMQDMEDGRKIGVTRTPTYFINGNMLFNLGYGPLKQEIQSQLNR